MSGEAIITLAGNCVNDPELKFLPSGVAVCNWTIASTPRTFNKASNEWVDGDTLFLPCSIWRDAAEHCADSLTKGMRVIVQGRLKQRSYETKEGERRTVYEVDVEEVGPSLLFATAKVTRVASGTEPRPARQPAGRTPPADPWAAQALTDPAPF